MKTVVLAKQDLRRHMRAVMKSLSAQKKKEAGDLVAGHVKKWLTQFSCEKMNNVALFIGLSDEISTKALDDLFIGLGAHRYLPYRDQENHLKFMALGHEDRISSLSAWPGDGSKQGSTPTKPLDLIFVPGLAFNTMGHRLGRGAGYYDYALGKIKTQAQPKPIFIGLAMDEQLLIEVPVEAHDVVMDYLCTPLLGMFPISR